MTSPRPSLPLRILSLILPLQLAFCVWTGFFQKLPRVEILPAPVTLEEGEMKVILYRYVAEDLRRQQELYDTAYHGQLTHRRMIPLCLLSWILVLFALYRNNPLISPGVILSSFFLIGVIALQSQYGILQLLLAAALFLPALRSAWRDKRRHQETLSQDGVAQALPSKP
ncbi:MAG: hypothetical protein RL095_1361 [Verrucomicrobiota bacterium]|jgi:heme A synthase